MCSLISTAASTTTTNSKVDRNLSTINKSKKSFISFFFFHFFSFCFILFWVSILRHERKARTPCDPLPSEGCRGNPVCLTATTGPTGRRTGSCAGETRENLARYPCAKCADVWSYPLWPEGENVKTVTNKTFGQELTDTSASCNSRRNCGNALKWCVGTRGGGQELSGCEKLFFSIFHSTVVRNFQGKFTNVWSAFDFATHLKLKIHRRLQTDLSCVQNNFPTRFPREEVCQYSRHVRAISAWRYANPSRETLE